MRHKKIATWFVSSYLWLSILSLAIAGILFMVYEYYNNASGQYLDVDVDELLEDYEDHSLRKAAKNQDLNESDYVEILDYDLYIIDAYNSPNKVGDDYSDRQLDRLLEDEQFFFDAIDRNTYVLLYLAPFQPFTWVFYILIGLFLVCAFGLLALFTSKNTKRFTNPIQELVQGAQRIASGHYEEPISYDSCQEFNALRDHINQMSQDISHALEAKEQVDSNRKQLIMNISHDMKTPLTNVIGYSESLLSDNSLSTEAQRSVEIIHNNGLQANRLINELFELSSLEMNDQALDTMRTDLCEFLRTVLIKYIPIFEDKAIHYQFDLSKKAIHYPIDQIKLERAIDNLIHNSIKYNEDHFDLLVLLRIEQGQIILTIADNGVGIPPAYYDTIFDPMVRVESSRNKAFGGSGLGLAITKKIVEKHGGIIRLNSNAPLGCQFDLYFPIYDRCPCE